MMSAQSSRALGLFGRATASLAVSACFLASPALAHEQGAEPLASTARHVHMKKGKKPHKHRHSHGRRRAGIAPAGHSHGLRGSVSDEHSGGTHAGHAHGKGGGHHGEGEIDTEHVFGFTEGSDVGEKGEKELESETTGRLGKRIGTYRAIESALQLKVSLTDDLRIAPGVAFSYHRAFGVPDIRDRDAANVDGLFLETRYRLLDREKAPFGLTFSATPRFTRIDELTGERVSSYGSEFRLLADRELVPGKLFAAVNLGYDLASTRNLASGEREDGSAVEVSGALAYQVQPGVFLGGEVRYARAYEGLGLDRFTGDAVFLGPTFFTKLTEKSFFSVAWAFQVAGREAVDQGAVRAGVTDALAAGGDPNDAVPLRHGRLNLRDFERHQFRIRLGYSF
jgi:hypothetical protein